MSDQQKPRGKPKNAGEAIYFATLDAREFSENLQPLLQLLDETGSEGPSPIDELKGILTAVIEILAHQNQTLARIETMCAKISPSLDSAEPTSTH